MIVLHAAVHGWIKVAVNSFFGDFYSLFESAGALSANVSTTQEEWEQKQRDVIQQLLQFFKIAAVAIVVMPISKYIRSVWALQWRMAIMTDYIHHWDSSKQAIEGASQRIHEDSYRFSRGVELCLSTILDSLITTVVFVPVLIKLGSEVKCPNALRGIGWTGDAWLLSLSVTSAFVGIVVTICLGRHLVGLEVANQRVEAKLRKDLVILESAQVATCVPASTEYVNIELELDCPGGSPHPRLHFASIISNIRENYSRLFRNFFALNLWLTCFDQINILLPFVLFSPLLFSADPTGRILLGTLVQLSNSYDKIFGSLSVVSENWGAVNEFRSVLVRLREFESNIFKGVVRPKRQPWMARSKRTFVEMATSTSDRV